MPGRTSPSATGGSSPSTRSAPRPRASTPPASSSRPASSTCTRTTTPSSRGTRRASPSPLHGVTTVFGGNCGFTLAPSGERHADYLMRMMARVEGMPLAALEAGLAWDWTGFDDWSSRFEGNLGVNAGFLVGHSAVRRVVMGERCHEPATDDADRRDGAAGDRVVRGRRARVLELAGADPPRRRRRPGSVARRAARRAGRPRRRRALDTRVPRSSGSSPAASTASPTTSATCSPTCRSPPSDRSTGTSSASSSFNPTGHESQLSRRRPCDVARGGRVVALTLPHSMKIRLSFLTGTVLDGLPGWAEVLRLPIPERLAALTDPAVRRRLDDGRPLRRGGHPAGARRLVAPRGDRDVRARQRRRGGSAHR